MTHTLHRTGTPIDQAADYTLMAMATKDANLKGSREKLVGVLRICLKHNPINIGDTQQGDMYLLGSAEEVFKRMVDGSHCSCPLRQQGEPDQVPEGDPRGRPGHVRHRDRPLR